MYPKGWREHWKKKYPGCMIVSSEQSADVYHNGKHKVSVVKNGAGMWQCNSEEMGCDDCLCLDSSKLKEEKKEEDKYGSEGG